MTFIHPKKSNTYNSDFLKAKGYIQVTICDTGNLHVKPHKFSP